MIRIVLAADGLPQEVDLVAQAQTGGIQVMRRPVDAAELLAAASCDRGIPVVVAASLPRISRDVLQRVMADGRLVIGLHVDAMSRDRLGELGVVHLVDGAGEPGEVMQAIARMVGQGMHPPGSDDPNRVAPAGASSTAGSTVAAWPMPRTTTDVMRPGHRGRIIAIWGTAGAPGRSVTAISLSEAFGAMGLRTCTVDADMRAPSLDVLLGLRADVSGVIVACRQAEHGMLDERAILRAARQVRPNWSILVGIDRPGHWTHVRPDALSCVLEHCTRTYAVTIVDLSADLPDMDDDPLAAGREQITSAVLAAADDVLFVTRADPLGLARLVSTWPDIRQRMSMTRWHVVLTGAGRRDTGPVRTLLGQVGIDESLSWVPRDDRALARCLANAATLGEGARRSAVHKAIRSIATALLAAGPPQLAVNGTRVDGSAREAVPLGA